MILPLKIVSKCGRNFVSRNSRLSKIMACRSYLRLLIYITYLYKNVDLLIDVEISVQQAV
jgi:hypothetical protein